jgi:trehalose 6-phosphate synthase
MSRLVVVSNRVAPITEREPTSGGLAAGVLDALKQNGGIRFGWGDEITDAPASAAIGERTLGPITLFTVDLSRRDYDEYYRGYAKGTLWPTLHYQVGHAHFDWAEFAGYRRVNELFAEALAKLVRPDDLTGRTTTICCAWRRHCERRGCAIASGCSCTRRFPPPRFS